MNGFQTPRRRAGAIRGFSLIELMIVVAIIGILAAIAIPAYSTYIVRSHVVQGTNGLSAARAQMEQFFQDNRTYTGGPCATATTSGDFSISCTGANGALTATTYTISATSTTSNTNGAIYTVDYLNNVATKAVPPSWSFPSGMNSTNTTCWVVKNGSC